MNGPFWMVFVNVLASITLLAGCLIFRFIYPKKKIHLFYLLILISLLPLISILRTGVYESGDFTTHVMEEMSFYQALQHGEFIPRWAGEMNATYGYPAFIFTYPLPFYLMAVFHTIGFSFITSVKLLLAASFFFSGIFMYLFLKKEVSKMAAFVGSVFYLFAPYHLIDLHFRADVGEVLAFVFFPLTLFAAKSLIHSKSLKWFFLEIISYSLLLLSHPALSFVGFVIVPLYTAVFIINQKKGWKILILQQILCVISALLLTTFYWYPILNELPFTHSHVFEHTVTFIKPTELLFSPWRFGLLFQGHKGELSFLLGYAQLLILLFAIILLFKKRIHEKEKKLLLISLLITFFAIFMALNISKPLWTNIPFIMSFQYSYRFLGIIIVSVSIVAAIVANNIKKKWLIIFLCFIAIFQTILNWGNRKVLPNVNDTIVQSEIPFIAFKGSPLAQAITVWSDSKYPWATTIPTRHLEIIKGIGTIKDLERTNIEHEYIVEANIPLTVRENTLYFPGWTAYIDYKQQPIHILTKSKPKGLISFTIPHGLHKITVTFSDTVAVSLGKIISATSVVLLLFSTIFYNFLKRRTLLFIKSKK